MAVENFQNTTTAGASSSTVSNVGGYTASDAAIDVADASKYPDPVFRLVNERTGELLRVTGKAADTLTVERGAEGTTAAAMNDADTLTCVLTRDSLRAVATNPIGDEDTRSQGIYLAARHRDSDELTYLLASADGKTWAAVKGTNLLTPASGKQRDPSLYYRDGVYWIAHTNGSSPFNTTTFTVLKSHDLVTWESVTDVDCSGTGGTKVWAPEWFEDDDGSVYVFFCSGSTSPGDMQIYYTSPTDAGMTTWAAPTAVTITSHASVIDPFLVKVGSTYNLWYKDESGFYIEYATSSTLGGPYTAAVSGDWAGWGSNMEGHSLVRVDADTWRVYFVNNSGFSAVAVYYSESADDWATWGAKAAVTTPWLTSHGTVLRLRDFPTFRNVLAARIQDGLVSNSGAAGVVVRRAANQSIPDATATALSFDTEDRDDLSAWSSGNPTRLTAPDTGWYTVSGYVRYAANVGSYRTLEVYVNGSSVAVQSWPSAGNVVDLRMSVVTSLYLAAGDYVEFFVFQDSAGAQNATGRATMIRH